MEYKKLNEILSYEQPTKYLVNSTDYKDKYDIPVLTAGQTFVLGYTNEAYNVFPEEKLPVIIFDDFTTATKFVDFPFKVKSTAMKILHSMPNINIKYIYYAMQTLKFDSSMHKRYWISSYSNLEVPVPKLEVQIKVANKLDKVQEIIDKRKKQIKELDQFIKSKFVEMFGNIKDNTNNYEIKYIKELVDTNINKLKRTFINGDKIKYIDISSIDNKENEIIGYTEYIVGSEPSRAKQCLRKNDIVISTVRPNLKNVAINKYNDNNIIGTSGFCVLRSKNCVMEYLFYIVISEVFTNDMSSITTGANYPAIHDEDILDYKIPIPPIELQRQFADFVQQIDKQKLKLQNNLEEMQKLQESLMNKYFSIND